jgi:hypothetical protein
MDTFRTIKHGWEKTKNAIPMDELMEGECNSFLKIAWEYNQHHHRTGLRKLTTQQVGATICCRKM